MALTSSWKTLSGTKTQGEKFGHKTRQGQGKRSKPKKGHKLLRGQGKS